MVTLKDILTVLWKWRSVNGGRTRPTSTSGRRHRRLLKWNRRAWRVIPARAVPPELIYERGDIGFMVPLTLKDDRAGRGTTTIFLEMKRVPEYGWYPVKPMLDARECAALLGLALMTFYKVSVEFESRRKIRGLVSFDTHDLFEKDLRAIDDMVERHEARRGDRPGKHAEYCVDRRAEGPCPHARFCTAEPDHRGKCEDPRKAPRRPRVSRGWTRGPRRPRQTAYERCAPDAPETAPDDATPEDDATRQTVTEALINETITDPAERAAMLAEQHVEIEEERKARSFVPKGHEIA